MAYGDVRNLLFDREIGTNIFTDLVTGKQEDNACLILLAKEIFHQMSDMPSILTDLTNIPDKQGGSIGLKVLSKLPYEVIN
jgi:hypothetical protein